MGLWDLVKRLVQRREGRERRGSFAADVSADAVTVAPDGTWMLRNSDYGFWTALRSRLEAGGIDPQTTVIAESFEEGPTDLDNVDVQEVGVLVSAGGQVVEYSYSYKREAWVTWDDITGTWTRSRHRTAVAKVLSAPP